MKLPILYHKTKKGKTQVCIIWTDGGTIFTKFGQLDGKMQTSMQVCKPKNVGKKNETTAEQQAVSEARSKWQKKKDKKYSETLDGIEEERISPMLAKKFTDKRIKFPCTVQRKLDGLRCMGKWDGDNVILQSRGNKLYSVKHIQEQLKSLLPKDKIFDGELYIHGVSLQTINSLVKKPKPGSEKLEFHVYDCCKPSQDDEFVYSMRRDFLDGLEPSGEMKIVESIVIEDKEELLETHSSFVGEGYEGTILRNHDGIYRFGYRSDDLLKYKDFEDAEFEIVGYNEGAGKFKGTPIWICKHECGDTFNVTPTGTLADRRDMFVNVDTYIGKNLTVKYIGKTDKGIPKFGVGKAIREDS